MREPDLKSLPGPPARPADLVSYHFPAPGPPRQAGINGMRHSVSVRSRKRTEIGRFAFVRKDSCPTSSEGFLARLARTKDPIGFREYLPGRPCVWGYPPGHPPGSVRFFCRQEIRQPRDFTPSSPSLLHLERTGSILSRSPAPLPGKPAGRTRASRPASGIWTHPGRLLISYSIS